VRLCKWKQKSEWSVIWTYNLLYQLKLMTVAACGSNQFQCITGRNCISECQACDGTYDCADGSDEHNCSTYSTPFSLSNCIFSHLCHFASFSSRQQHLSDYCNDESRQRLTPSTVNCHCWCTQFCKLSLVCADLFQFEFNECMAVNSCNWQRHFKI